jgi:hypothetical protein
VKFNLKLGNKMSKDLEEIAIGKKIFLWVIFVIMIVSGITWFLSRTTQVIDNGLVRYQEFQEIYNTTQQINQNICNLESLSEQDKMFKDFSKSQQELALKSNLNRWIAEYNAKSSLINFNVWKSNDLPHTLNVSQYNCL